MIQTKVSFQNCVYGIHTHALARVQACGRTHWCPRPDILTSISLLFLKGIQWEGSKLWCARCLGLNTRCRRRTESKWLIRRLFCYFILENFALSCGKRFCSEHEARQNGSKHITHLGIDMLGDDDYIFLQGETKWDQNKMVLLKSDPLWLFW